MAEKKGLDLPQILISAAVAGIVGFVVWYIQSKLSEKHKQLVFSASDTIAFQSAEEPSTETAIYQVNVKNVGNEEVKGVVCQVSYPPAITKEARALSSALVTYNITKPEPSSVRVLINDLNPTESVTISALVSAAGRLPSRPSVSLRGEGVVGKQEEAESKGGGLLAVLLSIIAAIVSLIASIQALLVARSRVLDIETHLGSKSGRP